jgi:ribose transport system substrate-binding protein
MIPMFKERVTGGDLIAALTRSRYSFLLVALAAALLVVAGCGGDDDEAGGQAGGDEAGEAAGGGEAQGPPWCGDEEVTIALVDGFGGNSWRKITRAEYEDEAKMCPSVKETLYADGQGNTQKAISDINGLVAQGVNAIIVFPDAGEAVLPAIRDAYKADVVMVPYRVTPGGEPGVDYNYFIPTDFEQDGVRWAEWMAKALDGKGKVVYLGGPPGVSESTEKATGINRVFESHPGIEVIGQKPYQVTNWDPAEIQRVIRALLARYSKIDGVIMDFGGQLIIPEFQSAEAPLPAIASEDSNGVACFWEELKDENPTFQYMSVSSQNWHVRKAVQFAVAEASGGEIPAEDSVKNEVFDDSIDGEVKCDRSLPEDVFLSSRLTKEQIREAVK